MNPLDLYARTVVAGEIPAGKTATIYALCDSREPDPIRRVRYIGQTTKSLESRLYKHWQLTNAGDDTYRARWMRAVRAGGGDVVIEPIGCVSIAQRDEAEIDHIARARAVGSQLTNATIGGDGVRGYVFSDEVRRKMSEAASKRRATPETREKMRVAMRAAVVGQDMGSRSRGCKRTEEHRRILAESARRRTLGVHWSEETRRRMSEGQRRRRQREAQG